MRIVRLGIIALIATMVVASHANISTAQPHLEDSLLLHLDLDLDKSALSPTNVQVRIHATDRINDAYYASPVDPDEDNTVEWNEDLPLMIDSNYPMRLIFHVASVDGSPLPAGYSVRWRYDLGGSASGGSSVTIPAGSSGDMNLTVQGTVVSQ